MESVGLLYRTLGDFQTGGHRFCAHLADYRITGCSAKGHSQLVEACFNTGRSPWYKIPPLDASLPKLGRGYRRSGAVAAKALMSSTTSTGNLTDASAVEARIVLAANTGTLDLSDCGLEEVPASVWNLTDLEDLSLAGNNIKELPPAIGNLQKLRRLGLAGNELTELPEELGRLHALEGLWLHGNLLKSLPDEVSALRKLRMLALAGNQLKALPATLGQLKSLQVLSVAGNELQEIPSGLGELQSLRILALYGNKLCRLPEQLSALTALQDLWLQGNRLETLPSLGGLHSLRQLSLADNKLGAVPESISHLRSLQTVWLYGNKLVVLPADMAQLPSLSNLWLESNPFDGKMLQRLVPTLRNVKAVGIDSEQASRLPMEVVQMTNLSVGHIAGTGAAGASGGYFKIQPWSRSSSFAESAPRAPVLVVAFGSAPGVPNWGGLLRKVRQAVGIGGGSDMGFDVLYVVDPTRSWYTHGPLGLPASEPRTGSVYLGEPRQRAPQSRGARRGEEGPRVQEKEAESALGHYYWKELEAAVEGYKKVVMLGDSMGASAALQFSPLATTSLAFCPQVDLSTSSIRPGRGQEWHVAFTENLLRGVQRSSAAISVHCGNWSHDVDQARLVRSAKVKMQIHPIDDHRLAKELDTRGELAGLIMVALTEEIAECGS